MLTIIGGTYIEKCFDPHWNELNGSGLRGAKALSGHIDDIHFVSCVGRNKLTTAEIICSSFNIKASFTLIPITISFEYYHPLSKPTVYPEISNIQPKIKLPSIDAECILMYGQIEAEATVHGTHVVYDPQNLVSFKDTGSTASHLALVLNRHEALYLSGSKPDSDLEQAGRSLLEIESAEVVVIKNGSQGALVIDSSGSHLIPVFNANSVWPIGSGDIFSAVFAWQWAIRKLTPAQAANLASQLTAQYCERRVLPLSITTEVGNAITLSTSPKKVYIAAPFFTMSERWLVNEIREKLIEFGNIVFSPFHDVGLGSATEVVNKDITAIKSSDALLAVINGSDPGTLFEIGYAKALGKKVIILAENINEIDLTMLIGTDCDITSDFSTAIYKVSW